MPRSTPSAPPHDVTSPVAHDRRAFIGSLASLMAAASLTGCAAAAQGGTTAASPAPGGRTTSTKWDDSWTTRLGRHRTVFDVAEMEAPPGVGQVPPVMDAYHEALGTTDADLGFVLLVRHMATPLLFNDALWKKYEVGAQLKHKDPRTGAPFAYNPVRPLIESLQQRGVIVLGCHTAAMGFAAMTAQKLKAVRAEVEQEVIAGLLSGAILQPNGLYALSRAQDVGCGFMR